MNEKVAEKIEVKETLNFFPCKIRSLTPKYSVAAPHKIAVQRSASKLFSFNSYALIAYSLPGNSFFDEEPRTLSCKNYFLTFYSTVKNFCLVLLVCFLKESFFNLVLKVQSFVFNFKKKTMYDF